MYEWFLSFVKLFQINYVQFLQMTIFLHLTAPTTAYLSSQRRSISFEAVSSNLGFLVSKLNCFAYLLLFLRQHCRFCYCRFHLISLTTVRSFGRVGFWVISRAFILFFCFALEKIESFVHYLWAVCKNNYEKQ